jgi:uncharacterized RDD family membrane protein YckC
LHNQQRAHSHRIIGSAFYDLMIVGAILMIAGAMALPINQLITGDASDGSYVLFQLYLVAVTFAYYLYFWKRWGQTVGMKAWRIKIISLTDQNLTWFQLFKRAIAAIPAYLLALVGVLWQYWDKDQLNWSDRASQTKLVYLPKQKKA